MTLLDWIVLVGIVIYFIPTIVAWGKKKSDGPIIINIFLGWTFIGWVVALAWAASLDAKEKPKKHEEEYQFKRWD